MADPSALIVRVPRGSSVEHQLRTSPPPAAEHIVLDVAVGPATGRVEPPATGTVVYSLPSPEGLVRERDEVRQALAEAVDGADEPLIVLLEAADELREDELRAALDAAAVTQAAVMLAVLIDAQRAD